MFVPQFMALAPLSISSKPLCWFVCIASTLGGERPVRDSNWTGQKVEGSER